MTADLAGLATFFAALRFEAAFLATLRLGAALLATLRFEEALFAALRFGAALRATLRFDEARFATLRFGDAFLSTLRFVVLFFTTGPKLWGPGGSSQDLSLDFSRNIAHADLPGGCSGDSCYGSAGDDCDCGGSGK